MPERGKNKKNTIQVDNVWQIGEESKQNIYKISRKQWDVNDKCFPFFQWGNISRWKTEKKGKQVKPFSESPLFLFFMNETELREPK